MDAGLYSVERRVAPAPIDQLLVRPGLDQTSAVDGDYAVAAAHRGQAVRDDDDVRPAAMRAILSWMMRSLS